jgi:hydroxyethylthiazole kinase-like sugar kinase family protein
VADSHVQNYFVLGLMGAGDLVAGIVLSVIGVAKDIQVAAIVGSILLLTGAGMLAYLVWSKSRPDAT